MKYKKAILILVMLLSPLQAFSVTYKVRTIYLVPQGVSPTLHNIGSLMVGVQETYRQEMIRYGYGNKTFELETDDTGQVVVHRIDSQNEAMYYQTDTISNIFNELPNHLRKRNNVHVIFVAGIDRFERSVAFASALFGGNEGTGNYGGYAFISENLTQDMSGVISHEVGHCFGLSHNLLRDGQSYIMGYGDHVLHKREAHWLSKNHYFNQVRVFNHAPTIKVYQLEVISRTLVKMKIDISDTDELYMIQFVHSKPLKAEVFLTSNLQGSETTYEVNMHRSTFARSNFFRVYVMDIYGNYTMYEHHYILPDVPEKPIVQPEDNLQEPEEVEPEESLSLPIYKMQVTTWAKIKQ